MPKFEGVYFQFLNIGGTLKLVLAYPRYAEPSFNVRPVR